MFAEHWDEHAGADWPEELIERLTREGWERPAVDAPLVLPSDLDSWQPGPVLAALLAAVDPERLSGFDRVRWLKASQRMVDHSQAHTYRAMTAISAAYRVEDDDVALSEQAAAAEIRAALRLTRRTAESELGLAHDLCTRLPQLARAMSQGKLDRRRAMVLVTHTDHLPVGLARTVCDSLVEEAGRWTTGQLTERVRRACVELDPAAADRRYRHAIGDRRVVAYPEPDGTISLAASHLPADRMAEAMDRINRLARQLHTRGETRTMDQLRADIFLDLLCGDGDHRTGGSVHLTVDLPTLTRLQHHPGELAGYGPVISDLARQLADHLTPTPWTFTVTHPATGLPLVEGTTRRRPTTSQTRRLRHRHPTCIFPGCRMPAVDSDLDHTTPWNEGGATIEDNLAPLCRHDHCLRHQTGWTYTPTPDGDHRWTSPLGHTHTTSGRDP